MLRSVKRCPKVVVRIPGDEATRAT